MRSFLAALRYLVLPYGTTTGARIVLDGVNGVIQVYDATNALVFQIDGAATYPIELTTGTDVAQMSGERVIFSSTADAAYTEYGDGFIIFNTTTGQQAILELDNGLARIITSDPIIIEDPQTLDPAEWEPLTFNGALGVPWTNFGAPYSNAGHHLMPDGTVRLRGLMVVGTKVDFSLFASVNSGYEPAFDQFIGAHGNVAGATPTVVIDTAGDMRIFRAGAITALSLDGITYPALI